MKLQTKINNYLNEVIKRNKNNYIGKIKFSIKESIKTESIYINLYLKVENRKVTRTIRISDHDKAKRSKVKSQLISKKPKWHIIKKTLNKHMKSMENQINYIAIFGD